MLVWPTEVAHHKSWTGWRPSCSKLVTGTGPSPGQPMVHPALPLPLDPLHPHAAQPTRRIMWPICPCSTELEEPGAPPQHR